MRTTIFGTIFLLSFFEYTKKRKFLTLCQYRYCLSSRRAICTQFSLSLLFFSILPPAMGTIDSYIRERFFWMISCRQDSLFYRQRKRTQKNEKKKTGKWMLQFMTESNGYFSFIFPFFDSFFWIKQNILNFFRGHFVSMFFFCRTSLRDYSKQAGGGNYVIKQAFISNITNKKNKFHTKYIYVLTWR